MPHLAYAWQQSMVQFPGPDGVTCVQLSETWRAHKEQLRVEQQEKEARAASPTPPARLTSQARQRYLSLA